MARWSCALADRGVPNYDSAPPLIIIACVSIAPGYTCARVCSRGLRLWACFCRATQKPRDFWGLSCCAGRASCCAKRLSRRTGGRFRPRFPLFGSPLLEMRVRRPVECRSLRRRTPTGGEKDFMRAGRGLRCSRCIRLFATTSRTMMSRGLTAWPFSRWNLSGRCFDGNPDSSWCASMRFVVTVICRHTCRYPTRSKTAFLNE